MKTSNERGVIFISFILLMVILAIVVGAFYSFSFSDFNATQRNEWMTQALYAAEGGVDQKLTELMQRNTTNITGNLNFDAGGNFQAHYDVFYGVVHQDPNTAAKAAVNPDSGTQIPVTEYSEGDEVIFSTGSLVLNGIERARKILRVTVQQAPAVNATASVAISGVASTNGAVVVDGREHDSFGNLTGAPGVYGISTSSSTYNQGGNSKVGGNGIAPANPANPATYQLNAPPLPNTPEKILGVSDGALDQFKTNTPPPTPFNGVVYLTTSWDGVNLNDSTGVLICHNTVGDAFLKNIHGGFKGVIITDDIIHINGDAKIIGSVFGMKTGGVTLGNGSGEILFSNQVLSSLPLVRYSVTSWEDSSNDSA